MRMQAYKGRSTSGTRGSTVDAAWLSSPQVTSPPLSFKATNEAWESCAKADDLKHEGYQAEVVHKFDVTKLFTL